MRKYLPLIAFLTLSIFFVTGCDLIGGIFQTGVGVGIFIAVVILIIIFFIMRMFRRR